MNVVNIFAEGQTVSPFRMMFLPLKILQYIIKRIHPIQSFGLSIDTSVGVQDIMSALKDYQVSPEEVRESLKVLRRPRDFDPYGLLYIDIAFDEFGNPLEE